MASTVALKLNEPKSLGGPGRSVLVHSAVSRSRATKRMLVKLPTVNSTQSYWLLCRLPPIVESQSRCGIPFIIFTSIFSVAVLYCNKVQNSVSIVTHYLHSIVIQ